MHVLEEHDETSYKMTEYLDRGFTGAAEEAITTAANAARSSSDPAPAANAARATPPILSWFDPEHRKKMEECHACMMAQDHTDLDRRIKDWLSEDEGKVFNRNMRNMVDSFLNAWFHDRAPARAASGAVLSTPTEGETERCARSIQTLVYQTLECEIHRQKNQRWPNRFDESTGRPRGNLPEQYDIGSQDGSD